MLRARDPDKPQDQEPSLVLLYSSCWMPEAHEMPSTWHVLHKHSLYKSRQLTECEEAQVSWLQMSREGSKQISLSSPRMAAYDL